MRLRACGAIVVAALACGSSASSASTVVFDIPDLTTVPNSGGGNSNGTGVWFNVLTGYNEVRGTIFPSPLFEDGKYFLLQDARFTPGPPAFVFTQGFFSRGNGVLYTSAANLNPARFATGATIGTGVGFDSPGSGFSDLGPTFGNWPTPGHGFLGLTIRDPSGSSSLDIFYGYAEITVNPDYSVTLHSFAYEDVRGASITTVSSIPEPTSLAVLGTASVLALRRKRN